jgi:hypothetical protein
MMRWESQVPVVTARSVEEWTLRALHGNRCLIELERDSTVKLTAEGDDLFTCLRAIRLDLEQRGSRVCCAGAALHAWPSPALRRAGARSVYKMPKWRRSSLVDLLPIFQPIPAHHAVSVAEQEMHAESLFQSRLWGIVATVNPISWIYALLSRALRRQLLQRQAVGWRIESA